jgi:hypothetical protein
MLTEAIPETVLFQNNRKINKIKSDRNFIIFVQASYVFDILT